MRLLAPILLASTCVLACRADKPEARDPAPTPTPVAGDSDAAAAPQEAESPPADPERAAKLADLDTLCKAVDHDYKDGTLGDYYAGLEMKTDWGKAQLAAGNESIKPARLLEKAVAELSPDAADPALEHCRVLLDYIDDVE